MPQAKQAFVCSNVDGSSTTVTVTVTDAEGDVAEVALVLRDSKKSSRRLTMEAVNDTT